MTARENVIFVVSKPIHTFGFSETQNHNSSLHNTLFPYKHDEHVNKTRTFGSEWLFVLWFPMTQKKKNLTKIK